MGNGTVTALYTQVGKTIHLKLSLLAGGTTSVSGAVSVSLPATAATVTIANHPIGLFHLEDSGVGNYQGFMVLASTTAMIFQVLGAASTYTSWAQFSNTVPYSAFASGDFLHGSATYEAA